jgi:spermidine synthase
MVSMSGAASGYQLPHLLNRDAGRPPFASVLIIGAGSGNDVAAALAYGATHVDAVEIDPAIYDIGRADQPDRPR